MNRNKIFNEQTLKIYFDDIRTPNQATVVANGHTIKEVSADKNDLDDVRFLAGFEDEPEAYHDYESEMQEDKLGFYYEIKNQDLINPFTDDDIHIHNAERRKMLEINWKQFRLSTGLEYEPMSERAYHFMEKAMEEYAKFRLSCDDAKPRRTRR